MNANAVQTLVALATGIGAGASMLQAWNAIRLRHASDSSSVVNGALSLVAALETENARLANENKRLQARVTELENQTRENTHAIAKIEEQTGVEHESSE